MNWKEFKEQVEAAGVKDDTVIGSIDVIGTCRIVDIDIDDGEADIY